MIGACRACQYEICKNLPDGQVDCDDLRRHVIAVPDPEHSASLISIMAANNETGVLQPLDDVAEIAADAGFMLHSDMVQYFGKHCMDFRHQVLDMLVYQPIKLVVRLVLVHC